MTVSSDTARADYIGNGVTVLFTVPFRFLENTHLRVIRTVIATGVETVLTLDSTGANGFTATGAGQPSGGSITVVTAPADATEKISILSDVPITQLTDYIANDPFASESHERALDKLTMIARALKEKLTRALTLPESVTGVSATLPSPVALRPLVWNAAGTGIANGDTTLTGDLLLRGELASSAAGKGASLVFPSIDTIAGVDPTGVSLSDTGFAAAAALGKTIRLTAGAIYYLSTRVSGINGTHFICPDGYATIKFKTGAGGFNSIEIAGPGNDKTDASVCGFLFSSKDDYGMQGVYFTTDGVAERVIYPIRSLAGCTSKPAVFKRIKFYGFKALGGGLLSINSAGDAAYEVEDIEARNCGTALNTWTGTPQITVFEIDNDLVGGVHSAPGFAKNIRAFNVLLTGAALTLYGQQTDCVNVAGVSSGTDRKGPTILGIYADGVGEVLDTFGSHGVYKGIRARNVENDVVKLVHGARYNDIEIEAVESCGRSVVVFGSSTATNGNTTTKVENNHVRIGVAKGVGTVGQGLTATTSIVLFGGAQGGATAWPVNNTVRIEQCLADASVDYIVNDANTADVAAGNHVDLLRVTGTPALKSVLGFEGNVRFRHLVPGFARATIGTSEAVASAVNEIIPYNTEEVDVHGEFNPATFTFTAKYPGLYRVYAQVRFSAGTALGDDCDMRINRAAAIHSRKVTEFTSGSVEQVKEVEGTVRIRAEDIGTTSADLTAWVTVTTPGAVSMLNTASMSFIEVGRVG